MSKEFDKWYFCPERECFNCDRIIKEADVKEREVVTGCPYCNKSFVE